MNSSSKNLGIFACNALSYAPAPNCKFNVDANSGHAFGILLAAVGALRPSGSGAS